MINQLSEEITLSLESAHSEDALLLIEHLSMELGARYGTDGSGGFSPYDTDGPKTAFVIARICGKPVGCGALRYLKPGTAEIKRMYVEPEMRGRGIARKVLHKLEMLATIFGYDEVWLETGTKQPEAIRLYEKVGYHRIECYGKYRSDPLSVCFGKYLNGGLKDQMEVTMNKEDRDRKIESYGNAYPLLVSALERFPKEMWQYRPSSSDWTIHEIIIHITDSEVNSYVRCRRLIAEPGGTVLGYNENKWAGELHYQDQSTDDALVLFKWLRRKSYTLIKDLPEAVWENTVNHSESGVMTMYDWLNTYERHIPEHIEQMQAVYGHWTQQK